MGSSYEETHTDIIESAKKSFLKKGFERSNLREICKGAHVTTGAFYRHFKDKEGVFDELVQSAIHTLQAQYHKSESGFYKVLDDRKAEKIWDMTEDSIESFIELIYDHYTAFKLLLMYAEGTNYSDFLHELAIIETKHTMKYMVYLKKLGYPVQEIAEQEVHMLIHAYFSSIFEIVMHDYKKEEAVKYSKTIVRFYRQGWKDIFGI